MRAIGLDVHLEFCEVAIAEGAELRSAGRIATKPEEVELFAQSLGARDRVALEVTGNAWEIKRLIEPHVAEVIVVSPRRHRDPLRAGEDRPARRASAGEALGRGRAQGGLDARPRHPGDAQAPSAPRPAGLGALAGKEPDPREPDALPRRPRPVLRSLRGQGPALAGRARAGRGGARVGRLSPAPGRVPRLRDRGGRALDLGRRARERRGEAADDGAGGERDLRGDLHGGGRRDPPLPLAPQAGRLPRARSQGPPVGLGLGRPRAGLEAGLGRRARHALVEASWSDGAPAGAAARLLRADPGPPRPPGRDRRLRAKARLPLFGACSPAQRTTPTRNRR